MEKQFINVHLSKISPTSVGHRIQYAFWYTIDKEIPLLEVYLF